MRRRKEGKEIKENGLVMKKRFDSVDKELTPVICQARRIQGNQVEKAE